MKYFLIFIILLIQFPYINAQSNLYREIDSISQIIKKYSSNEDLYYNRAILYFRINEFEHSLNDINTGLSINPKSDRFFYLQALVYLKKKHMDSALESINESIKISKSEKNHYLRSKIHFARNEIREAILDLNIILKMNPRADYAYLQKAFWCNDINMYYEEIKNYLYYIKISDDDINVSQIKKKLKKIKKSDKYYADLIRAAKKEIKKNGYPWEYKVWE